MSGPNAVTQDGKLFNIDSVENRTAAITFGAKSVIIACGMNKILNDAADALYRTRNIAAPINAQRFDIKTPCKINGKCVDCSSPDSICNVFATTRHPKPQGRIKLVLIGENFDF